MITLHTVVLLSTSFAQERYTVFYFGATSCGPCNRPEVVESIKKLKVQFKNIHHVLETKFVMVCMDTDFEEGLKFVKKYGFWDEISIGSHYDNELVLSNLSKTDLPGVPHILVYHDTLERTKFATVIKTRRLVKDILGGDRIVAWVDSGVKLE